MSKSEESGLMGKAATLVAEKATQVAGGFVGEKAGEIAGEVVREYSPQIKRQFKSSVEYARRNPKRAAAYALVAGAILASIYSSIRKLRKY